jgi:3-oxoacyl-[acyl-carrier-protein] synthase II
MIASTRRAVVTGIGAITPLGLDLESFRQALRNGRSGIRTIQSFDTSALPVRFGGEVIGFDARNYLDKKDRKRLNSMARTTQLAVGAAQLAVDDARLDTRQLDPARFGVVFGTGSIPGDLADFGAAAQISVGSDGETDLAKWGADGLPNIAPTWMLNHVPNMPACHVSITHNAQGPNNTVTQTDAASLMALGEAFRLLTRGGADVLLVGGADTRINPYSGARHVLYSELSRRADAPEKACRPFERQRDGGVLSEGGAVLVIEELEHARRRRARIYAEIAGFGAAFDRSRDGAGLARAVQAALAEAGIRANELDHVNAHGASTVGGDALEARGLVQALDGRPVSVFAPKSYFGDLGAGASAAELAASLLALVDGVLPATLNYDEPDPACPVAIARVARPVARPYVLKVGLTERGQCAAVVVRRWTNAPGQGGSES